MKIKNISSHRYVLKGEPKPKNPKAPSSASHHSVIIGPGEIAEVPEAVGGHHLEAYPDHFIEAPVAAEKKVKKADKEEK